MKSFSLIHFSLKKDATKYGYSYKITDMCPKHKGFIFYLVCGWGLLNVKIIKAVISVYKYIDTLANELKVSYLIRAITYMWNFYLVFSYRFNASHAMSFILVYYFMTTCEAWAIACEAWAMEKSMSIVTNK